MSFVSRVYVIWVVRSKRGLGALTLSPHRAAHPGDSIRTEMLMGQGRNWVSWPDLGFEATETRGWPHWGPGTDEADGALVSLDHRVTTVVSQRLYLAELPVPCYA